ncbi:MAG: EVE domain-containing protein [Polyangiaceae bacterium]|nr:EVE domain-containing protein [Polyangiaceae bacterium]
MKYWLLKSEPSEYGWDDLVAEKEGCWDGVRNYAARNFMREMEAGDLCFFYHSQKERAIVGIARVTAPAFPDPTDESGRFVAIKLQPVRQLERAISLSVVKADQRLQQMPLVRQPRLSVQPVTKTEFAILEELAAHEQ